MSVTTSHYHVSTRGEPRRGRFRPRRCDLVAEHVAGRYDHDGAAARASDYAAQPPGSPQDPTADHATGGVALSRDLVRGIEAIAALDIDALDDVQLAEQLSALKTPLGQLRAVQARWAAALESRRIAAAPPQRQGAAQREARNTLSNDQQLTPSEAKRLVEAGQAAGRHRATGAAFDDGDISAEHVRVIARLLRHLSPAQQADLEPQLLTLARRHHATRFGREARRLVAEACPPAAADAEDALRGRRFLRASDTPDGGFAFSGMLYGTAAETARVALDAFTRPDAAGEHRTREQAAADGFEQLCAGALRTGDAPTQHGARPQVLVAIDAEQLAAGLRAEGTSAGRFVWSGQPVTTREIGHILDDCTLVGVVNDADRTPIEVTKKVRTVPTGLWRALLLRDGGCRWPGCDAPAAWCDVAHGHTAYTDGGLLSPQNAALLCRSHHRRFDLGPWVIHVKGDAVTFLRPLSGARAGPREATSQQASLLDAGPAPPTQEPSSDAGQPPPAVAPAGSGWVTPDGRRIDDPAALE